MDSLVAGMAIAVVTGVLITIVRHWASRPAARRAIDPDADSGIASLIDVPSGIDFGTSGLDP